MLIKAEISMSHFRRIMVEPFSMIFIFKTKDKVPGILHASRESRAEGLRQYKLGFGSNHDVFVPLIAYETDHGMNDILEEAGLLVADVDFLPPRIYFNPNVIGTKLKCVLFSQ